MLCFDVEAACSSDRVATWVQTGGHVSQVLNLQLGLAEHTAVRLSVSLCLPHRSQGRLSPNDCPLSFVITPTTTALSDDTRDRRHHSHHLIVQEGTLSPALWWIAVRATRSHLLEHSAPAPSSTPGDAIVLPHHYIPRLCTYM